MLFCLRVSHAAYKRNVWFRPNDSPHWLTGTSQLAMCWSLQLTVWCSETLVCHDTWRTAPTTKVMAHKDTKTNTHTYTALYCFMTQNIKMHPRQFPMTWDQFVAPVTLLVECVCVCVWPTFLVASTLPPSKGYIRVLQFILSSSLHMLACCENGLLLASNPLNVLKVHQKPNDKFNGVIKKIIRIIPNLSLSQLPKANFLLNGWHLNQSTSGDSPLPLMSGCLVSVVLVALPGRI